MFTPVLNTAFTEGCFPVALCITKVKESVLKLHVYLSSNVSQVRTSKIAQLEEAKSMSPRGSRNDRITAWQKEKNPSLERL